jgi:hypothetical protein
VSVEGTRNLVSGFCVRLYVVVAGSRKMKVQRDKKISGELSAESKGAK